MCPRQFLAKLFQQCLKTIYLSGKVESLSTAASNIEGQVKRCVFDQNELKNNLQVFPKLVSTLQSALENPS